YPDRVDSVILSGSGASVFPRMTAEDRERARARSREVAPLWGTPDSTVVDTMAPSLAGNQEFRTWHQKYERNAATADSLVDLLHLSIDVDVSDVVPQIDVPVLLLHRIGDRSVSVDRAREVKELLPSAVLIELPGDDHFSYAGDMDGWLDEIERWVTGDVKDRHHAPTPEAVRITTLGRFAVEVDGEEVPTSAWGSRLARTLCKRLVAARGWPVTRDELMDLLWPDEFDPAKLGARLSVQLSAVRRVLGGGVIADRQAIRLDLDEVSTDLEEFHQVTDDGAIIAAYTGDFLPEDRYEDWTGPIRDEARTRFVTAARRIADGAMDRGVYKAVIPVARRLIEVDAYDENAHQMLVTALIGSGEEGEARKAHKAWAKALAELDVIIPSFEDVS
ncbi:MAG: hypothetical protein KJP12_02910, partial [Acidimicrobiia bacterium]|nr:hypothetical protein [Acidimicrobiia bacterium]